MIFLEYLIPGSYLHKKRQILLGDALNLTASFCLILLIYWIKNDHYFYSLYLLLFVLSLITINIWQMWSIKRQISEPANLEFQEKKIREILTSFLLGKEVESLVALQEIVKAPHLSYDMEILLAILLQRNDKHKEANELIKELENIKMSNASESLLYSIKNYH